MAMLTYWSVEYQKVSEQHQIQLTYQGLSVPYIAEKSQEVIRIADGATGHPLVILGAFQKHLWALKYNSLE